MFIYIALIYIVNAADCISKKTTYNYSSIADGALSYPRISSNSSHRFTPDHVSYHINSITCGFNNTCNVTFFQFTQYGNLYNIKTCQHQCSFIIEKSFDSEVLYSINVVNLTINYNVHIVGTTTRCNYENDTIIALYYVIAVCGILIVIVVYINCRNFKNKKSDITNKLMKDVPNYGSRYSEEYLSI